MTSARLHSQAEPSDLPLVLLPPFPFDHRPWAEVAERLGGDVILVDPPGFGGACDGEPSLEAYAAAVLAALDERGATRFVVAGNSMGGYGAMALAEAAPDRVAGIGLFGTKSTADDEEARRKRLTMAERADRGVAVPDLLADMLPGLLGDSTRARRPQLADTVADWTSDASPAGIAWAQRAMAARRDRTDVLERSSVPAAVVRGTEDALMDADAHQQLADALGCPVQAVEVGHLLPLEAPEECAAALRELWEAARD